MSVDLETLTHAITTLDTQGLPRSAEGVWRLLQGRRAPRRTENDPTAV